MGSDGAILEVYGIIKIVREEMRGRLSIKRSLLALSIIGVMSLSGCTTAGVSLATNAVNAIGEVKTRNLAVLEGLHMQGLISTVQYETQSAAVITKADSYIKLLSSGKKEDGEAALKQLNGACVSILGHDLAGGGKVGLKDGTCEAHGDSDKYISGQRNKVWDGANLAEIITGTSLTPKSDANVVPLDFLDSNNIASLVAELNRKVYVLDENKVKTMKDWEECMAYIQQIKNNGDKSADAYRKLISSYFKDSSVSVYNYAIDDNQVEEGQAASPKVEYSGTMLVESTDNSAGIGKSSAANKTNKDLIVNASVSVTEHTGGADCEGTEKSIDIGAYQFRVKEFNADLVDEMTAQQFTKDKYIAVDSAITGGVGVALLMEYPVVVPDKLTSNATDGSWEFEFKDAGMYVNIYSGEMLAKDSTGKLARINQKVDGDDLSQIYRVIPMNSTQDTTVGQHSSFIPRGKSKLGMDIITNQDTIKRIKLLSAKQTVADYPDINLEDGKYYPVNYMYSHEMKDYFNSGTYDATNGSQYSFKDGKSDTDIVNMTGVQVEVTDKSVLKQINDVATNAQGSWDSLSALYTKLATEINTKTGKSYDTSESVYGLNKVIAELVTDGKLVKSTDRLSKWFTTTEVYNSLEKEFGSDLEDILTDYDKIWLKSKDNITEFTTTGNYNETVSHKWYHKLNLSSDRGSGLGGLTGANEDYYDEIKGDDTGEEGTFNLWKLITYSLSGITLNDPELGKTIELQGDDVLKVTYDATTDKYTYAHSNGTDYNCSAPVAVLQGVESLADVITVRFALRDFLELTYLPEVVKKEGSTSEYEKFIAVGRRISLNKLSSKDNESGDYDASNANSVGDTVVGSFVDKRGDVIDLATSQIKLSDIIDYESGNSDYYEQIAMGVYYGAVNTPAVQAEVDKAVSARSATMKEVYLGAAQAGAGTGGTVDPSQSTGMLSDTLLLPHKVFYKEIKPVLRFSTDELDVRPAFGAVDVGNTAIENNIYFGLCVNTNAIQSGLWDTWVNAKDTDGVHGNLAWWNKWLGDRGYLYKINIADLKAKMSKIYTITLAELDNTIVFNTDTLKVINTEMKEEAHVSTTGTLRAITSILGGLFMVYGFLMMSAWLIDINMVNGPGILSFITFGRFISIRDSSEIPVMVDGKVYADFKYLCVVTVIMMMLGIMLVVFDIQDIWVAVSRLLESFIKALSDIMLNK